MQPRHPRPSPHLFLMTDERVGDALWPALARLPRGAGIVFRHYGLPPDERRTLFERVRRIAARRGLLLVLAGPPRLAVAWRADGAHGRSPHRWSSRPLVRTAPCHDRREVVAARRNGAALLFVSPIHATRSHPDGRGLGKVRAGLVIGPGRGDIVALGGMTRRRADSLRALGITRWAAIDAWLDANR